MGLQVLGRKHEGMERLSIKMHPVRNSKPTGLMEEKLMTLISNRMMDLNRKKEKKIELEDFEQAGLIRYDTEKTKQRTKTNENKEPTSGT